MEVISQGAEAILYSDRGYIIKSRLPKGYRQTKLDVSLRRYRTRREAKVLEKLSGLVDVPGLICYSDGRKIFGTVPDGINTESLDVFVIMDWVDGDKLKDILDSKNHGELMKKVGRAAALMHHIDIVHGDFTTSNMILTSSSVSIIDFGLSYFSEKLEDKAVDIHLFRRALESGHPEIAEECFRAFCESYSNNYEDAADVFNRLEKVEMRGRHKQKHKGGSIV
ncbi:MAG: KEOPS complex kinase/ATPase Bud32 [Candidatus Woesearchaeota archaeon]